jgi:uncharacterized repeat protein (TIGR01451 family)
MTFKVLISTVVFTFSMLALSAQEEWINIEKKGYESPNINRICVDKNGNTFLVGRVKQASFDTNATLVTDNVFIAKFSPTGQNLWVRAIASINTLASIAGIVATEQGDILLAGTYTKNGETILGVALPVSDGPLFGAKISANGDVLWVKKVTFPTFQYQETYCRSITTDGKGNCFIAFTHSQTNSSEATTFIAKMTSTDGSLAWLKTFQGANISWETTRITGISADSTGNLYATGHYTSQFITADTSITQSAGRTIFIAKFDSSGNKKWMRLNKSPLSVESNSSNTGFNIIVSKDGKYLYTTGYHAPDTTVAPQYAFDGMTPKGKKNIYSGRQEPYYYISLMDPLTGTYKWVKTSPYGDYLYYNKLALDSLNNCYMRNLGGLYQIYDSIPMPNLSGGIVKINDKGTIFPPSPLGDNSFNFLDFAIYKNRFLLGGTINAGTTNLYYQSAVTPVTVNRINRIYVASFKIQDNNNFSIKIDSIKTTGECFKAPLSYKLRTSTFRTENQFVVQMTDPNTKDFESIYVDTLAITATKLDSFSRLLNPNYNRYNELDSLAKIRICSTNPVVCSTPFFLNNPKVTLTDRRMCKGDTIRLSGVTNAFSYEWSPSNKLLEAPTLQKPLAKPDSTTLFTVKIKTNLGCTYAFSHEVKVIYADLTDLKDTVVIPCNSKDDAVQLLGYIRNTNSYFSQPTNCKWQPTKYLSDSTTFTPIASPIRSTKYYVTIQDTFNRCVYKDSVFVKVDSCKIIYGKTTPDNYVQALVVNSQNNQEVIKEKKADAAGNYLMRLPKTDIYARTTPYNGNYIQNSPPLLATYFDSSLTIQKARLIHHTADSLLINFFSFKNNPSYSQANFKGFVYNFNDPTLPIKDLDLMLTDTNTTKILRGRFSVDSLSTYYAKTSENGSFQFSSIQLNRPYFLWANQKGINNDIAPNVIVFKKDENERVFYLKDSLLINCSETGSPCGTLRGNISTTTYNNCNFNFGLQPRQAQAIKLMPLNVYTATDSSGNYQFRVPPSTYVISTVIPNYTQPICGTSATYTNIQVFRDSSPKRDFKFYSPDYVLDYATTLTPSTRFRPGFENTIVANIKNVGIAAESHSLVVKYPSNKMVYLGNDVNIYADTTISGEIKFGYIYQTNASNADFTMNLRFRVFPTTRLGDSIVISSKLATTSFGLRDSMPANNVDTIKEIVIGSFDPNDKEVSPKGNINPTTTDRFAFTIRFQNTGTDTAFNIVVRDTLSDVWNPLTLQTITSSHPYRLVLKEAGIVEFRFQNILLVDSFKNEKASHGFVKFSIQPKEIPLSIGTKLQNKAGIYFDFNAPIITNTTLNTVVKLSTKTIETQESYLTIYPNPAKDALFIQLQNTPLQVLHIDIYNSLGQLVGKENLKERVNELKINHLTNGLYFIKITNGQYTQTGSFIIAK